MDIYGLSGPPQKRISFGLISDASFTETCVGSVNDRDLICKDTTAVS